MLTILRVGSRVRLFFGGSPHYGTVVGVGDSPTIYHTVKVKWDVPLPGLLEIQIAGALENEDAPMPKSSNDKIPF